MPPSQEDSSTSSHPHTPPSTSGASTLSLAAALPVARSGSNQPATSLPFRAAEPLEVQTDSAYRLTSPKAGDRRPPPSPAHSPSNVPAPTFASLAVRPSVSYKRARTVSPIIDDNSSDVEQEHRSVYSQAASDNDSSETPVPQSSLGGTAPAATALPVPASPLQPTPLRQSHSFHPNVSLAPPASMSGSNADASDKTIEGLMTEKSLRLDDAGAKVGSGEATDRTQAGNGDGRPNEELLPSYIDATSIKAVAATVGPAPASLRPAGGEQLRLIRPMKNEPMVVGETWYLLDRGWYKLWSTACALEPSTSEGHDDDNSVKVGPIDNRPLLNETSTEEQALLRTQINEGIDFEMLPEKGWHLLASWYGVNGPVFARKVVEGVNAGQESVEFYPPQIRLLKVTLDDDEAANSIGAVSVTVSASQPLSELKAQARQLLGLGEVGDIDMRFWHVPEAGPGQSERGNVAVSTLRDEAVEAVEANENNAMRYQPDISLRELGIDELTMTLAVETRAGGRWISNPAPVLSTGAAAVSSSNRSIFSQTGDFFTNLQQPKATTAPTQLSTGSGVMEVGSDPAQEGRVTRSVTARERASGGSRGLRGLNNLGNTCFMNSALQCLSNTYELQQYFVSGAYKTELNTDNPLGMGGAIAEAFGNLIKQLWDGQGGSFWPREFKHALARFAPQFSGYAQHDSQELLAFLLDGLHEDLNRIIKKPYVESPDWMGGGEKEMVAFAKKQWDLYKARNDSVIVDLFQGQYKSTLVCPDCEKVSIKFDPFMYLTLPIPNKKKWRCPVFFVPYDSSRPITKFDVQLPAGANVGQLKQKVAAHFDVNTKKLVGGEIWSHRMFKWIHDYEPIIDIKAQDYIYFWELPTEYRPPKRTFKGYRYHSTVADAEEGLVIPAEEAAILPVFTSVDSNAASSTPRAFVNRRVDHRATGLPFFISVPRDQVNDPEAIQSIILEQYKRFSAVPDQLAERAAAASSSSTTGTKRMSAAGSTMQEWELVDGIQPSHDTHADSVTAIDVVRPQQPLGAGVVTEIREDGEAVVVPDVQVDEAPVMVEKPSEPAAKPAPSPSKPLFSIKFTTVTEAGQPFPKGGNNDSTEHMAEGLAERLARLQQALPTSVHTDAEDASMTVTNDVDGEETASRPLLSPPGTPELRGKDKRPTSGAAPLPLVYTSGALVCSWTSNAYERYLVSSESGHHWGVYADAVDEEIVREDGAGPAAKPKALSIEDCMDEFTREEKLGEDDPWYCPSCKDFRQATKKFDLWKAPDILVVHLKRFSAGRHSRDKLNVNVDFPLEGLDLSERVEGAKAAKRVQQEAAESGEVLGESMYGSGILQPENDNDDAVAIDAPIYDLYGVDNHFGGLGGGHYTAYAKSPSDGKWYEFDDSSVRPVANPEQVKSSSAYLLFYRRRTTRPIGGKSRQKFQQAAVDDKRPDNDESVVASQPSTGLQWSATASNLSSPDLDGPHPPGWLAPFRRPDGDGDEDDYEMFKPVSSDAASSAGDAEPGSPRSTLSSLDSPVADA